MDPVDGIERYFVVTVTKFQGTKKRPDMRGDFHVESEEIKTYSGSTPFEAVCAWRSGRGASNGLPPREAVVHQQVFQKSEGKCWWIPSRPFNEWRELTYFLW